MTRNTVGNSLTSGTRRRRSRLRIYVNRIYVNRIRIATFTADINVDWSIWGKALSTLKLRIRLWPIE
jgi:hypothetical protein